MIPTILSYISQIVRSTIIPVIKTFEKEAKLNRGNFVFFVTVFIMVIPQFHKLQGMNLSYEDKIYNDLSIYGTHIILASIGLY